MIAIVDYGVGNIFSLKSSLAAIGQEAVVTADPEVLKNADKVILPGVGAYRDAIGKLKECKLDTVVKEIAASGKPLLGICLGMQLMLDGGVEYGNYEGLGLIDGIARPISEVIPEGYKVPHMGWNALKFKGEPNPIFKYISEGDAVYFVHSYHAAGSSCVSAVSEYGGEITAAIRKGNVYGCQFHPEKSGTVGLNILRGFADL